VDELASSGAPPVLPSFLPSCKPLLQKPKQGIIAILDDHQVPIRSSFGKSSLLRTYWTPIFSDPRPSVQSSLDSLLPLFGVPKQAISLNNQLDKSLLKKIVMKSPKSSAGPDGIPFCFFKCQWKSLKVLLCKTVSEAALPDCLPISFNEAYIALIPKGKSICKPDEVRPITVTNSIYRIVGKYYVVGFIKFINQFISHTQQAILPGRSIAKYLIRVCDFFLESTDPLIGLLQSDFKKAYDFLNHNAILQVPKYIGTPSHLFNYIYNILHPSYCYFALPNGSSHKFLVVNGVKQGCPILHLFLW